MNKIKKEYLLSVSGSVAYVIKLLRVSDPYVYGLLVTQDDKLG